MSKKQGTQSEKHFSQTVFDFGRTFGWLCARFATFAPTHTTPGFPDLVMVRDTRIIFAELKVGPNKLTDSQIEWRDRLMKTSVEHYVWYPEDWEEIEEALGR